MDSNVQMPSSFTAAMEAFCAEQQQRRAEASAQLTETQARLRAQADAMERRASLFLRPLRDIRRRLALVDRALAELAKPADTSAAEEFRLRFLELARQQQLEEKAARDKESTTEERFLPSVPAQASSNTLTALARPARVSHAANIALEMQYALHDAARPVDLIAADTCSACGATMKLNQVTQQLVCPTPNCGCWKPFPDMTAHGLPFGEDREFCKFTYRPVSHLDDIIRTAEGTETKIVPAADLERVMVELRRRRVAPDDLSIPLIRDIIVKLKNGLVVENTVQIFSRLSGQTPRRMTSFMKDQMRIMFLQQQEPYRKHRNGRKNNLSFPFTLYKNCELLGYFEMLESFQLLRGPNNLSFHDSVRQRVCEDLDWQHIPTVAPVHGAPRRGNLAAFMSASSSAAAAEDGSDCEA